MQINLPKTSTVFFALLKADFTTQWRNRRAALLVLLVPVLILISWKSMVTTIGGAFVLSTSITIGLVAIGLMGYTNSIARDRDKGIFQRLRVAPVPSWCIIVSRLCVQLVMIMLVTVIVFVAGYYFDQIMITPIAYSLAFIAAIVGGAVYLSLGQVIVGRIKNPETVNSATRLVYFAFIMIGMFGELGLLGADLKEVAKWSPYGTVITMLSASLTPGSWNISATYALLATMGYTVILATLGIKWFKWNTK
jgi:ABC-2 type transport system permease protein